MQHLVGGIALAGAVAEREHGQRHVHKSSLDGQRGCTALRARCMRVDRGGVGRAALAQQGRQRGDAQLGGRILLEKEILSSSASTLVHDTCRSS